MRQGISRRMHFPPMEKEILLILSGFNGIHHDRKIARCRILHADRNPHAACNHPVKLILDRARPDGSICQ